MADEFAGGAQFKEVIEVAINTGSGSEFDKGLKQMLSGYRQFLADLKTEAANNGVDPQSLLGMDKGGMNAIAGVISELRTVIKGLRTDIREAFDIGPANNITSSAHAATAALEETAAAAEKMQSAVSGSGVTDINAKRTPDEKLGITKDKATAEDQKRYDAKVQLLQQEQQAEEEERASELAQLKEWITEKYAIEDQYAKERVRLDAQAQSEIDARRDAELASLKAQITEKYAIEDQWLAERNRLNQVADAKEAEMRASELSALKADIVERSKIQEQWINERTRMEAQYDKAQQQQRQRELAELKADIIDRGNNAPFMAKIGFEIKGILEDLPQAIAHVTKFFILWTAITKVAEAFIGIVRGIKDEFAHGFEFLAKDEQTEEELRAVLLQSVEFADKNATGAERVAQNYERAGVAAKILRDHLEKISVQTGLDPKAVTGSFQSFLNAGGAKLTGNDLVKAADTTGLLDMAVKLNNGLMQTRTLTTQIQAFVRGNVEGAKTLLTTLGLSIPQAKAMVDHAKTQGDLYEQLIKNLDGVHLRLLAQAETMKGVEDQFAKARKDIDEQAAKPIFDKYKEILLQITQWLEKNKVSLGAIGESIGTFVARLMGLAAAFGPMFDGLKDLAPLFVLLVEMANTVLMLVTEIIQVFFKFGELVNALRDVRSVTDLKKAWGDFYDYLKQKDKEFSAASERSHQRLVESVTNVASGNSPKMPGVTGNKDKPDFAKAGKELQDLSAQYREHVAQIKQIEDDYRNGLAEAVADHTMSVKEATEKTIASVNSEREAVQRLTNDYTQAVNATGATADQKKKAIDSATIQVTQLDRALGNIVKKANIGLSKDDIAQMQEAAKAQAAMAKAKAEEALADAQYAHSKGGLDNAGLARAEAEAHNANYQALLNEAYAKLAIADQDELARKQAQDEIDLLNEKSAAQQKADARSIQDAQNQDHLNDLKAKSIEADTQAANAAAKLQAAEDHGVLNAKELLNLKKQEADARAKAAQAVLNEAEAKLKLAEIEKTNDPAGLAQAEADVAAARVKLNQANNDARNFDRFGGHAQDVKAALGTDNLEEAFKGLGNTLQSVNNAMKFFGSALGSIINGFKQGGVGGGLSAIGGVLGNSQTMGAVSGLLGQFGRGGLGDAVTSVAGPLGAALSIVGSVASLIGGMFTKAAQKIGQTIAKEMQATLDKYGQQQLSMGQTIQQLQQERQQAIQQLSGKKGGQDQLNKLLPQIDQNINQLVQQRDQIEKQYVGQLVAMQAGGGTPGSVTEGWVQSWEGILQQTKDFLGAWQGDVMYGSAVAQANEYLRLQLQQQRIQLQDQFNDGEKQAIQDALSLNDLLTQRNQIESDYKKQKFDILSADALERRVNTAVSRGQQLADLKKQHDQQIADIDSQISLTTQKVNLERTVFNIAQDTATLKAQSNALELQSLNEQLAKYREMAALLASTANLSPVNGMFGGAQPLPWLGSGIPGQGAVTYTAPTVNIYNPTLPADPNKYGTQLQRIIDTNGRRGIQRGMLLD